MSATVPLEKNGVFFTPIEKGAIVPDDLLARAQWAQKTGLTKIFMAIPSEDISQASGERKLVQAKGGEIVFDNGFIPLKRNANGAIIESRHDIFLPTDANGKPTGADIRDQNYRMVGKGVETILLPALNGGEAWPRDYGMYLPTPNVQAVVKLDSPAYVPNAFGPGDHQWLDKPVLRLAHQDGEWRINGAVNGPEFDHTWTILSPLAGTAKEDATLRAEFALRAKGRAYALPNFLHFLGSLASRFAFGHWTSQPEGPKRFKI